LFLGKLGSKAQPVAVLLVSKAPLSAVLLVSSYWYLSYWYQMRPWGRFSPSGKTARAYMQLSKRRPVAGLTINFSVSFMPKTAVAGRFHLQGKLGSKQ